jgi:hypothetical protein
MKSKVTGVDITRWTGCPKPAWDFTSDRWACGCDQANHGYDSDRWLFIREWDPGKVLHSVEVT